MKQDDHNTLFSNAMEGVKPLKGKKQTHTPIAQKLELPESTMQLRRNAAEWDSSEDISLLSGSSIEPVDAEQLLQFKQDKVSRSQFSQLKKGRFPVECHLDLHGYTVDQSISTLQDFLKFCRKENMFCVCIIHGKSSRTKERQNTLKSHVNRWLQQRSDVRAFCSAPNHMGGTGSLLVLLAHGEEDRRQ